MNKKSVIEYLINKTKDIDVNMELIEQLEDTKSEIYAARSMFDNVNDSKLIEVAIYAEEMAKKRYDYLLLIAKSKGIKVTNDYIFQRNISSK
ncbi:MULTISPECIES: DUF2508 family protein [unclassified Clostridium]|uniref:DUF2508 family protein n=1 Tax=unclassified Clostridium TaxID=2614128 RepID=UPI0013F0789C|nr:MULTISPECIES: DUF2508 family protein [unclassified Clostridium]NFR87946.1 DUF2508 family protein [Clostridium botulinum]NFR91553.1 DUF2508 family protein [Clostridium botulinum]NFS30227.1 DUF2508 family protein [Clostridium botulinum]NFS54834.1 DUF2508 family protein [Clostridium botulinum]NFT18467.1 DUF2508 family protein [Clostridium botulinum]